MRAEDEFDELYRTSRDRLVVQIAAITGDPSEARDFVQEAFIRAWTKWDRISTYDDPEGWIRRVAYRLAVGRWRRSRRLILRADVYQEQVEIPGEQAGVIDALQRIPSMERRVRAPSPAILSPTRTDPRLRSGLIAEAPSPRANRRLDLPFSFEVAA